MVQFWLNNWDQVQSKQYRIEESGSPNIASVIFAFAATGQPLSELFLLTLDILVEQPVAPLQLDIRPLHDAFNEHVGWRVEFVDLPPQEVIVTGCVFGLLVFLSLEFVFDDLKSVGVHQQKLKFLLKMV